MKKADATVICGYPIPGKFEGTRVYRFPRTPWCYPIPIRKRFEGKMVSRFPRLLLVGGPPVLSRQEGRKLSETISERAYLKGRKLSAKEREAFKRTGRPRKYETNAERQLAYRQRKSKSEGRVYGYHWNRQRPKLQRP
jgi:hypothetical protein